MKRYLPELEPNGVPNMDSGVVRHNWGYERSELKTNLEIASFLFKLVGGVRGFSYDALRTFIPGSEARKEYLKFKKNRYNNLDLYRNRANSNVNTFLKLPQIKESLEKGEVVDLTHRNTQMLHYKDKASREVGPLEHIRVTPLQDDSGNDVTEFDVTTTNRWEDTGGLQTRVLFFATQTEEGEYAITDTFVHNRSSDNQVHSIDEYVPAGPIASQSDVYDHIERVMSPLTYALESGHPQSVITSN